MNSPISPGSNNAAISAMAAATTQLKHDGIYYYSADLNKDSGGASDVSATPEKDVDNYYYGGVQTGPSPASFLNASSKPTGNDTYYDDGDVGDAVAKNMDKSEKGQAPSTNTMYKNVSSLPARTANVPFQKIKHPPLPVPPVPPVPIPKNTDQIYKNDVAETSFGTMPTYGNAGPQKLPGLAPDDNYESLDSNTRHISAVYAELK
ncbi:uncharacterized protein LOC132557882 [Ylistrum balloti]|uniref:uncharacterized protein LOC132557882 n=1 Tax=Ylistrum balloti TaxID=509963 RepID=UPI00290591EC|nr:uncharacterized protein LOC132557882 [Ylistrum balloti]